ncbi:hypothetical protein ACTWJ8_40510 (plasmid) [Streptomyces sp. SDT5-1]|uniref:hypothetical protein n=1 Tax=Streptomyces sp. SDT5-1 TaxID=3406418 RepID=UPI003FD3E654
MSTRAEIAAEYVQLQRTVKDRHADLAGHTVGDEEFASRYGALLEATDALLESERTLPSRLAEPDRQLSERIVRCSWLGQVAVAIVLAVLVFALDRSAWWLVVLVPHTIALLAFSFQKVTEKNHRFYRHLTIGLHMECVLVALIVLSVISAWFLVLAIFGWLVLGVSASEGPSEPAQKGRTL